MKLKLYLIKFESKAIRFESEQLTNSKYFRPIRSEKLKKFHDIKEDQKDQFLKKDERDYVPVEQQTRIETPMTFNHKTRFQSKPTEENQKTLLFKRNALIVCFPKAVFFQFSKGEPRIDFFELFTDRLSP